MGWLTTEELWWNADGTLMTHAPSTYKIPAVNDCPADFRTTLFRNSNVEDTILRSKAMGEPPLLLPFSVFFAIRDAIASVGDYRFHPPLDAPATGEAILRSADAVRERAPGRPMSRGRSDARLGLRAGTDAAAGRAAVLVTVVGQRLRAARSRHQDAGFRRRFQGTIGGGHLEFTAIDIARGQFDGGGPPHCIGFRWVPVSGNVAAGW